MCKHQYLQRPTRQFKTTYLLYFVAREVNCDQVLQRFNANHVEDVVRGNIEFLKLFKQSNTFQSCQFYAVHNSKSI